MLRGAMTIDYHGVKPPDLDTPLIEFETDNGLVDLYNDYSLRAATFDAEGLAFDFAGANSASVRLQFREVKRLRVEQPADWMPREADQIDHLLIRAEGPWPRFEFKAGGLRYEFDAEVVALARTSPSR